MTLTDLADLTPVVSVVVATVAAGIGAWLLWYAIKQLSLHRLTIQAQLALELRRMLSDYQEIHIKLRPSGEWYESEVRPGKDDFPEVEAYMGLFEHFKILLDKGLLDWETFIRIYAYRVRNIMANKSILNEKLVKHAGGWGDFIDLVLELEERKKDPGGRPVPNANVVIALRQAQGERVGSGSG